MTHLDIPDYATLYNYSDSERREFIRVLNEHFSNYDFRLEYTYGRCYGPDVIVSFRGNPVGRTSYIKQVTKIVWNHINSLKLADKMKKSVKKAGLLRRRRSRDLSLRAYKNLS